MEASKLDTTELKDATKLLKDKIDEASKRLKYLRDKSIHSGATEVPEEYTKLKIEYNQLVEQYKAETKRNYNPDMNPVRKFAPQRTRTVSNESAASNGSDRSSEGSLSRGLI